MESVVQRKPPNQAPEPGQHTAGRADGQNGQIKKRRRSKSDKTNKRPNFWPYIGGSLSVIIIVAIVVVLYFNSERSAQQKKLQNEVEDCMANLSETHGEVYQLNLDKVRANGSIDCLVDKLEDCKTRLSEKSDECIHLQDECRKEKEQLEQAMRNDLKTKVSEMENERDLAKRNYGKEKQENEECKSKLSSETKRASDLEKKLKTVEKRLLDQKEGSRSEGFVGFFVMVLLIGGCIALCGCIFMSK